MRIPQLVVLLAVALCAAPVAAPARAEIRRVAFPVRGMICPLCTRGVEQAIGGLPGVGRAAADLATGRVEVEALDRQTLDIQKLRDRAARAGFPVNGLTEVEARGRFEIGPEGKITFRATGTTYAWQVVETSGLLEMFRGDPALKKSYQIDFRLHERGSSARPVIAITSGQPVTGGPTVARTGS